MSFLDKLLGKSLGPVKMTQTSVRTVIPQGEHPDHVIIERLKEAGLDLSTTYHVRHIFTAPTADAAHQLQRELESRGLKPELSEEGGQWKIAASEDMLLEESSMAAMRAEYSTLATNLGGKYAGWELKASQKKTVKIRE